MSQISFELAPLCFCDKITNTSHLQGVCVGGGVGSDFQRVQAIMGGQTADGSVVAEAQGIVRHGADGPESREQE